MRTTLRTKNSENYVRVGVAAIVRHHNKVLLGMRLSSHGKNTWGFPGGKLEFGETFKQCVNREVLEETGLKVRKLKFVAVTNDIFNSETHYITIFMVCYWKSGKERVMESDKLSEWKWFDWEKLPKPLFLPIINLLKQKFNPLKV